MMASGRAAASRPSTREQRREWLSVRMRCALAGDREDLNVVVEELTPLLWRVARSCGLDVVSSEDVVQQTWFTLLRNMDAIRSPDALVGWLVTVCRRESLKLLSGARREQPVQSETFDDTPSRTPDLDERLISTERQAVLWRAFRQLPERCARLLQVIASSDRPNYAAVASALGMPVGSIGPTRGRCLAKLRQLLESQPDWSQQ